MSRQDVTIPSPEGDIRAFVFTPETGDGPWPTALMFMDGLAIRASLFGMAQRLADHGYYVLLPDMYWRLGPYEPLVPAVQMATEEGRNAFFTKYFASTDGAKSTRDTKACLDWLSTQPKAKADKVGVFGYCMGGTMSLRAAGNFPDRVAAVGAFHSGFMVSDHPDSPHAKADKIKAKVLVAAADKDAYFDEAQKAALDTALKTAGVHAEVTTYEGALHGYAVPDSLAYDEAAAERHWRDLVTLFDGVLK